LTLYFNCSLFTVPVFPGCLLYTGNDDMPAKNHPKRPYEGLII